MALSLTEISVKLGAELLGPDALVDHVASLETAGPSALSLCTDRRRIEALRQTQAAGVLLLRGARELARAAPGAVLLVGDVRLALAEALELFHPERPPEPGVDHGAWVDSTARVDPSARIEFGAQVGAEARVGARTLIDRGAQIAPGAVVGADCRIGARALVLGCCQLGDRVRLGPGSVLGSDGFGYATTADGLRRIPQVGTVEIGDDVELGANCTVDRGTLGPTTIGPGTKIDNLVQVGHNVTIGRSVCIAAQSGLSGSVRIEDGAVLGGQVGVADRVTIGAGAQVGGKSGVGTHVPAGSRVAGYPAVEVKTWLASVFGRRRSRRLGKHRTEENPKP